MNKIEPAPLEDDEVHRVPFSLLDTDLYSTSKAKEGEQSEIRDSCWACTDLLLFALDLSFFVLVDLHSELDDNPDRTLNLARFSLLPPFYLNLDLPPEPRHFPQPEYPPHLPPPPQSVTPTSNLLPNLFAYSTELTMQNAVYHHHPLSQADYRFTNRALGMRFTKGTGRVFRGLVKGESRALGRDGDGAVGLIGFDFFFLSFLFFAFSF